MIGCGINCLPIEAGQVAPAPEQIAVSSANSIPIDHLLLLPFPAHPGDWPVFVAVPPERCHDPSRPKVFRFRIGDCLSYLLNWYCR